MPDEPHDAPTGVGDMSDVLTGPIGDARLVVPARSEDLRVDIQKLPAVETTDPNAEQRETAGR